MTSFFLFGKNSNKAFSQGGMKMLNSLKEFIKAKLLAFRDQFLPEEILDDETEKDLSLLEMISKAKEEWIDAKRFFEEVTDPMLVDHAIYRLESAEKRYMYLLKIANQEKLKNDQVTIF